MRKMRVLIACEYSGATRRAFEKRWGDLVEVVSCDLLPADDGAKNHYTGSVFDIINDGWDFMLGHPPCTYLTNAGVCHLHNPETGSQRWLDMRDGAYFFKTLADAPIPFIVLENPIMHKYAVEIIGGKADQYIQPWQFGHAESKRTGLWLKNLPKLRETNNVYEQFKALPKAEAQRMHYVSPNGKNGVPRWKIRSETYQGIADAIADQYGAVVLTWLNDHEATSTQQKEAA